MVWRFVIASILLFAACGESPKQATTAPVRQARNFRRGAPQPPAGKFFRFKEQFRIQMEGDAVVAAEDEFPANRWYDYMCGGTIVWENVMITAAHCVENDKTVVILVSGTSATCEPDRQYTVAGAPHDLAACVTAAPISERLYETVDLDQRSIAVHDPIMLTGFADPVSGRDGFDLMGRTTLESIVSGVFTTRGGAWVTKGDSGSPAFTWKVPANRRFIAVNSAMAPASPPEGSLLSSIAPSASFLVLLLRARVDDLNGRLRGE